MSRDLTPRQKQIAELVAAGLTTKQIARVVRISPRTVEAHVREAAEQIPGDSYPRHKLTLWFLGTDRAA